MFKSTTSDTSDIITDNIYKVSTQWAEVSLEAVFRAPESLFPSLAAAAITTLHSALRWPVPGTVATVVRQWLATASIERLSYTKDLVKINSMD